jgi:hypothetical protein
MRSAHTKFPMVGASDSVIETIKDLLWEAHEIAFSLQLSPDGTVARVNRQARRLCPNRADLRSAKKAALASKNSYLILALCESAFRSNGYNTYDLVVLPADGKMLELDGYLNRHQVVAIITEVATGEQGATII